ncbi:MAG: CDP-alcohol phosphatidyltransferase family protein [Bellilinea sp.]|jgi:phosphatidylglycerophosphate synthase
MEDQQLKSHQRINDILLGPLERPALAWLARKMPAWVTPDLLTGLGFAASILIFVSYWLTSYSKYFLLLASLGFILNWFGDSLDGTLARHRKIERPRYGFFIDHITDTFSEILVFIGIGLSPYVDFHIALIGLISYLNISILVYLIMVTRGVFKISLWKIGPTEIRMLAILANIAVFFVGNPIWSTPVGQISLYNTFVIFVTALLLVFFLVESIRTGSELARQDDFSRLQRQDREQQRQARRDQKEREKMMRKARKSSSSGKSVTSGVSR